ncbi:MAG: hypothetical protein GQ570_08795 [Helicobacteraceae bacterium]|nr:hypothetical protein [Helicobacteraceae bacterium]
MNNKNLLISTILATFLTGCGYSTSGGGGSTAPANTITAVDAYILNAQATAYYYDENSALSELDMLTTESKMDSVTATKNVKGTAGYSVTDAVNLEKVRYYSIQNRVADTIEGTTTVVPATFIDNGSVEGIYDDDDTLFVNRFSTTTKLYAPASGFTIITPITNIIFEAVGGVDGFNLVNMGEELNASTVEESIKQVASILNLDESSIKGVDPLNTTDVKYQQINTYLSAIMKNPGDATKFTVELLKEANATTTTTYAQTIEKLNSADEATSGSGVFGKILEQIATVGETTYLSQIGSANLDASVNDGGNLVAKASSTTAIAKLNTLQINAFDTTAISINGDKIATSQLDTLTFQLIKGDINTSADLSLIVQLFGGKYFAEALDANEMVVKISLIKLINDVTDGATLELNSSTTKYSLVYQDHNLTDKTFYEFHDQNASNIGLSDSFIISDPTTGLVTLKLATLLSAIETNATVTTKKTISAFTKLQNNVSMFKVAIVDNAKLTRVSDSDESKTMIWGDTSITSVVEPTNPYVKGTGKTVISTIYVDFRGSTTKENSAPLYNMRVLDDSNLSNAVDKSKDINGSAQSVMLNYNSFLDDRNVTFSFNKIDSDVKELYTLITVVKTELGELNVTTRSVPYVDWAAAGILEVSVDTNTTYTYPEGTHPFRVLTYSAIDEFYKSGIEQNVTIKLNRAPETIKSVGEYIGNGSGVTIDLNQTSGILVEDSNITLTTVFGDKDGMQDFNSSASEISKVCFSRATIVTDSDSIVSAVSSIGSAECFNSVDIQPATGDNVTITGGQIDISGNAQLQFSTAGAFTTGANKWAGIDLTIRSVDKYDANSSATDKKLYFKILGVADGTSNEGELNTTVQ